MMHWQKKIIIMVCLSVLLAGCSGGSSGQQESPRTAISAEFPLVLEHMDLGDKSRLVYPDDQAAARIDSIVRAYASAVPWPDARPENYINTLCLQDQRYTVYVVLMENTPFTYRVSGIVLFYDKQKKAFVEDTADLGLEFLYSVEEGRLLPTNLKTEFGITSPELERTDFDGDGIDDFKFTSLIHNGTFNALETRILNINELVIDTLYHDMKSLMTLVD